ncbi:RDD family protein [Bacillus sp. sid0103]|uniref:RDD family protein n=1 Tax=Bacillus sp. sid0103 TaxID=2856337 RepID=UPI001C4691A9|nr:RDD family protein [Bacillus sp. sid0103]MBV7507384.1 RDD family protein [Bacillus sp. sid0103]
METNEYQENSNDKTENHFVRYAGFWMRFWAYLLDLVVVGSIVRLLLKPVFRIIDIPLSGSSMFAPLSIASAVIFYLYFVLMTKYFNQTLGKMVFGLKVIDLKRDQLSWGSILFREWIGRYISATILVGYIIVAFLPKKQGLHDLFTDTTVIHIER